MDSFKKLFRPLNNSSTSTTLNQVNEGIKKQLGSPDSHHSEIEQENLIKVPRQKINSRPFAFRTPQSQTDNLDELKSGIGSPSDIEDDFIFPSSPPPDEFGTPEKEQGNTPLQSRHLQKTQTNGKSSQHISASMSLGTFHESVEVDFTAANGCQIDERDSLIKLQRLANNYLNLATEFDNSIIRIHDSILTSYSDEM